MINGMSFNFFWLMPLVCIGIFIIRKVLLRGREPKSENKISLPKREQPRFERTPSVEMPEELKQAGRQVLDGLDWEIRLLEKQHLEATNSKGRQEIIENLKRKREEYQATVERFKS